MAYSVAQLKTIAECDAVLNMIGKEKADLQYRQTGTQRKQTSYSESSTEIATELTTVNAEITAYESIMATLPEGDAKDDTKAKLKKMQYRQFLLTERKENYGVMSLMEKEMDLGMLEKQLAELEVFQAAVTTHKGTL
jgi:hypothetical protein